MQFLSTGSPAIVFPVSRVLRVAVTLGKVEPGGDYVRADYFQDVVDLAWFCEDWGP